MELVAASKMRKAVNSVLSSRPYAEAAWAAISEMASMPGSDLHPLLQSKPNAEKVLVLLFTSDRGLCGGFNAQMIRKMGQFLGKLPKDVQVDFVTVGRKGTDAMSRKGENLVATFTDITNEPTINQIKPISDLIISDFTEGKYRAVYLAFTDYVSALVQKPNISQLLPLSRIEGLGDVSDALKGTGNTQGSAGSELDLGGKEFLFEPSPREVLDAMLPRLVEAQIYQAVLETAASEHSARMMAMRTASDSANEMIESLTLSYNRARQAGITAEIAEISSGKAALENN